MLNATIIKPMRVVYHLLAILTGKGLLAGMEHQQTDDNQTAHIQRAHEVHQQGQSAAALETTDEADEDADENEDADFLIGTILADVEHGVDGIGGQSAHAADGGEHGTPEASDEDVGGKAASHGLQSGSSSQSRGDLDTGRLENSGTGEEDAQREHGKHTGEDQLIILDEVQGLRLVPTLVFHGVSIPKSGGTGGGTANDAGNHGSGTLRNFGDRPWAIAAASGAPQRY